MEIFVLIIISKLSLNINLALLGYDFLKHIITSVLYIYFE